MQEKAIINCRSQWIYFVLMWRRQFYYGIYGKARSRQPSPFLSVTDFDQCTETITACFRNKFSCPFFTWDVFANCPHNKNWYPWRTASRWRSRELIYLTEADASLATIKKKKKKRSCAWLSREAINEMFINANLHSDRSYCSFWWKFHLNGRITFRLCKCVSRNFAFLNFAGVVWLSLLRQLFTEAASTMCTN